MTDSSTTSSDPTNMSHGTNRPAVRHYMGGAPDNSKPAGLAAASLDNTWRRIAADPTGIEGYADHSYLTNYQLTIAAAWASAWTSDELLTALDPSSPDHWDDELRQTFVSVVLANETLFAEKMPAVLARVKELAAGFKPGRHLFDSSDYGSVPRALDPATTAEAWARTDPAHVKDFFDSSKPRTYGSESQRASFLKMLANHEDVFQATAHGREILRIARDSLSPATSA